MLGMAAMLPRPAACRNTVGGDRCFAVPDSTGSGSACLGEDLSRFQWLEACGLNRPSPELQRENGLGAMEKPILAFSNP